MLERAQTPENTNIFLKRKITYLTKLNSDRDALWNLLEIC